MALLSPAVEALRQLIAKQQNIVFFGGAGMSTESGIPDFRGAQGLYNRTEGKSYEEMLSIAYFQNHMDAFWHFYKEAMLHPEARPNAGHTALARLEKQGKLKAVLTQNIDGLHQDAGAHNVCELHGTVRRNLCLQCGKVYDLAYVLSQEGTPRCACGGILRPDIVFYGEPLDQRVLERAVNAVTRCDLILVGGTSLTVYPAAGLLEYRRGAKLALINRDETPWDMRADLVVRDSIAATLDAAIAQG
ncbi:MAG: NAD-dependent protein deacylase [Eubacteriales bacterium]|nr:NAD-dependent protein deacylase [Eubacteriales bacterium]